MDVSFDQSLAAVTLVVDGAEWGSGFFRNFATNPGFESAGSTVQVAENHFANPGTTSFNYFNWWAGSSPNTATPSIVDEPRSGSGKAVAYTWSNAASNDGDFGPSVRSAPVGEMWTIAYDVAINRPDTIMRPTGGGGPSGGSITEARWPAINTILQPGEVQRRWHTFTRAAGSGTDFRSSVQIDQKVAGDQIRVFNVDLYPGAYQPSRKWFSGSYSPDPDFTTGWVGEVNNSASRLWGKLPATLYQSAVIVPVQSTKWSSGGTHSARVIRKNSGDAISEFIYSLTPGKTYTLAVNTFTETPTALSGPFSVQERGGAWRSIHVIPIGTVLSGPGLHRLVFTLPSDWQSSSRINFRTGPNIWDSVYWDNFTIVEGSHPDLMPFSGSVKPAGYPGAVVAWDGAAEASSSTMTVPNINRMVVERQTPSGWQVIRGGEISTIGGYLAITDIEMPLHQTVNYRVQGFNNNTLVRTITGNADTQTTTCHTYIKTLLDPNATIALQTTEDPYTQTTETAGAVYDIIGGNPIAIAAWSGINANQLTLTGRTKTRQESNRMTALTNRTRVALIQTCIHEPFPSGWYYISSVTKQLRGNGAILDGNEWTLPLTACATPSGDTAGRTGGTWAQLQASYDTWADVKTQNTSWFSLITGDN